MKKRSHRMLLVGWGGGGVGGGGIHIDFPQKLHGDQLYPVRSILTRNRCPGGNVLRGKCPTGEMSYGGNVLRGKCPRGKCPRGGPRIILFMYLLCNLDLVITALEGILFMKDALFALTIFSFIGACSFSRPINTSSNLS